MCVRVKRKGRMTGGGKAFGNKGRDDKKQRPPTTTLAGQAFSACSGVTELGRTTFEFFCFVVLLLVQSCTLAPSGIKKKRLVASFFWSLFPPWSMVMLSTKCLE
ncbi:hypothetical protein K456DRAFT_475585 [Colletotrichum gloeosporioides 23]|nr:hypothetical protein K456DRAFT_475585 [Colletotrichum gloeosporioides 23]